MARFDLHAAALGTYWLDVQTDLIWGLGTRLVIPLYSTDDAPRSMRRLHPVFEIGGQRFVLATHLLAAVDVRELGPKVGSLDHHYDEIKAAIDMILLGF